MMDWIFLGHPDHCADFKYKCVTFTHKRVKSERNCEAIAFEQTSFQHLISEKNILF